MKLALYVSKGILVTKKSHQMINTQGDNEMVNHISVIK